MSGLSLGTRMSNLKSVALTVLELLTFNAQKFRGSRDPGHAPIWEIFGGSCPNCPWELGRLVPNLKSVALTVFELLAFNSHDRPLRARTHTHTHTQTNIERTHYLRHSLRSLGGDNNLHGTTHYMISKIKLVSLWKVRWTGHCVQRSHSPGGSTD